MTSDRIAVVRVYVHVEDDDTPGYFVDIEMTRELRSTHRVTSKKQFRKAIAETAEEMARKAARRLYDKNDPDYGEKEVRAA